MLTRHGLQITLTPAQRLLGEVVTASLFDIGNWLVQLSLA